MASSINPSNIDGTYPVAGQDNDSQGFRDNFTNTKTNFTEAKSEIEALQTGSVSLSTVNDFNFTGTISEALMKNNADVVNALGTLTAVAMDHATAIIHTATLGASGTVSFTNWPASGSGGRMRLILTIANVAHTLTLPAAVTLGADTVQGISSLVITFSAAGTYIYDFSSIDGGTNVLVEDKTQSDASLGNIEINANVISSTNTNGNITLTPNGTGAVTTDNLSLDGNTVAITDTNGNLVLSPNGTGTIDITGTTATISTSTTNQALALAPHGTGTVTVPALYKDRAGHGTNSLTTKEYVDATIASGTIANIPLKHGVTITISGATAANPVVITTSVNHNLEDGCKILIAGVGGMTELNSNTYYAKRTSFSDTTFALYNDSALTTAINGSAFTAYTSGGSATITEQIDNGNTLIVTGGTNANVSMTTDKFVVNVNDAVAGLTSLTVDQINIDGNTIISTDTNGHINLDPNGTGRVIVAAANTLETETISTASGGNNNMTIAPDGTGIVLIGGTNRTISTTSTNTDLTLNPNGTGVVIISTEATVTTLSTPASNTNLSLAPNGTGTVDLVGTTATISTSTTNQDLGLDPNGTGTVDFNVPVQTTVGSAGGASAVPAAPTTYMKIEVGGTAYVVPCFAVS